MRDADSAGNTTSPEGPPVSLVTGAAGLIGSHVVERRLAAGERVVGVDDFNDYYDPAQKRANVQEFLDHPRFTLAEFDLRDRAAVDALFDAHRPARVAHLAAMANVRYAVGRTPLYTEVNVLASVHLLEAAKRVWSQDGRLPAAPGGAAGEAPPREPGVFAFASTSSAYGKSDRLPFREDDPSNEPLSAYPATKKAVELLGHTYHNLHGMNFTALRFFSVYGPRARPDMMPFMVTDRVFRGEPVTLFSAGELWRDWTYVGDIADGVCAAMDTPLGCEVVNLGRGEPVRMADFVEVIESLVGRRAVLETPPAPASEPVRTAADITKARRLLGYDPRTPVGEGLARLWDWYRSRGGGAAPN